jgi:hypothetical protein
MCLIAEVLGPRVSTSVAGVPSDINVCVLDLANIFYMPQDYATHQSNGD